MKTATAGLAIASAAAAFLVGVAACGGGSTTAPSATTASAPTAGSAATGSAGSSEPTAAGPKVSANTASEDDIAAALEAAGVANSERWAEEVVEYRPYPADDPDLTKLRDNLAKYNPGQETTDRIVSALTP